MIEFLEECPPLLREAVRQVWRSFSGKEKRFLRTKDDRYCVGCEDVREYDGCYGKVFVNRGTDPEEFYIVNIWPSTLNEEEKDLLYVVAHEFGHLFELLAGHFTGMELSEERAEYFAYSHGFPPKKIKPLPSR